MKHGWSNSGIRGRDGGGKGRGSASAPCESPSTFAAVVVVDSDSQLMKDGAAWSRRVKVTRAESGNESLRLHWISQDWGLCLPFTIGNESVPKIYHK